ncbi:GNAT family N-acetyltransferase [Maritalea sp.]|uniref:GNAT family N-acetyltransferase n=1 Tax=Maritalea sp. TaxID=2003361 RepID=UPI003EF2CB58
MLEHQITVEHKVPSVEEYCAMRIATGLSAKTEQMASIGLPNSIFAISIRDESGDLIAMGRLVGDGGCFVQVADIAVRPDWQGQGLGRKVMQELMTFVQENLPKSIWVNLFADGTAKELYKQFGFGETAPSSVGMAKYST